MFLARYNVARHESICEYPLEPRRKVLASEVFVHTATRPSSTPTSLQCDIEQEAVTSNVSAISSKILKVKTLIVVSHRMVEELKRKLNKCLELQSLFWTFADFPTRNWQRSCFSSYPVLN